MVPPHLNDHNYVATLSNLNIQNGRVLKTTLSSFYHFFSQILISRNKNFHQCALVNKLLK